MGKKWTAEEERMLTTKYETAKTVEEVAVMLGRPIYGVTKKALSMGLKRPALHDVSIDRLKLALEGEPKSAKEIAAILDMAPTSVCALLRRASTEGICHVIGIRPTGGRGNDASLWMAGRPGSHAADYEIEKAERSALREAHAAKPFKAFRDPFVAAFYGERAAA
jgi:hypothetical protein